MIEFSWNMSTTSVTVDIQRVRAGLPIRELDKLAADLGLPRKHLLDALRLSERTVLWRASRKARLSQDESQRVIRARSILDRATELFGSKTQAAGWITSPADGLGGVRPIDWLDTDIGYQNVEALLTAIEWGNYF
jgi:putative toxin-antitoxin system antitoxin component (TIGR02293 family)